MIWLMLVLPFSRDEIDSMVKAMPPDKALGPDGFNTDFIKHYWSIICDDFLQDV
jgi:hypothetical protein